MENTVLTPEVSASGSRNAFHHQCRIVGHYRAYAVCVHLCNERKHGRLSEIYADCSAAIGKRDCPALHMMQKEKEEGRAIYFIERVRSVGEAIVEKAQSIFRPSTPSVSKSKPSKKSSVIDQIDEGSYADAINAVSAKTVEASTPATKLEPMPGESLLQCARRMMSNK